jgi:hypothetical protein
VNTDGVQAVLLVTSTPFLEEHKEFLRLILAAVGEPAAQEVQRERLRYSDVIRHSVVFRIDELPIVVERMVERVSGGVQLLTLSLADVVAQIATSNSHLDAYRVWQDLLRIVASLFAKTGTIVDLDRNQLLLCLHGTAENDLELIVHHIGVTITELLPEVTDVPVLRFDSRAYPEDGSDLLQLARSLI